MTINHQPSTVNRQPSTVNCQPTTITANLRLTTSLYVSIQRIVAN
ncbi:hypothetical protein [Scytonema millei]|nr:hypothetical protein [Scytonema millei]